MKKEQNTQRYNVTRPFGLHPQLKWPQGLLDLQFSLVITITMSSIYKSNRHVAYTLEKITHIIKISSNILVSQEKCIIHNQIHSKYFPANWMRK